ncbi:putative transcriptional regulator, TetR family protein [Catellatospora methionotrophica]|uniref:Putative transcriptional regulator, TetR family protein n=1 Tax=Catellatospora methionotrophica TaxID=121620 RepID=A0A8J3LPK8_9ACTN|nr:TetR family transcriptional regulator [Catellatospora methionotrophica]GIG18430.1 putative transcriptional regulator, TetR family protein [Catellatospora methionotrophica]
MTGTLFPLARPDRDSTRAAIVAAARELTVAGGWARVRMAGVAERAGVSRQTVYNEFGGRAGLADALADAEIALFTAGVRRELSAHGPHVRAAVAAAVRFALAEAAANPLIRVILTGSRDGADPLLPYLTTRSDVVMAAAAVPLLEWAGTHLPTVEPGALAFAAETVIRLAVSHVVLPLRPAEQTADALAGLVVLLLGAEAPR